MAEAGPFDAIDDLDAEELRQRFRSLVAVIERAPVPIAIAHDPECQVITANEALAALLQLPTDANISLTPPPGQQPQYRIQVGGRDVPPEQLPMQYAIAHRTRVSNEIEIVRPDGSILYVQNDVEPLFDRHGAVYGCVSVCVDMTSRRDAEMMLRLADRRKDEFLATLSHELRNPLAPMRAALEVMRLAAHDPATVEKSRATMERQLQHLVRLTDDLLDVARITQHKFELRRERVDLRSVVHSAIEATRPLFDARGQSLGIDMPDTPLWVDADMTRLTQAFSNVLNNAAKYTDRGGRVHLATSWAEGVASIAIEDTGVGISAEMLPRVFDMFTQLKEHGDRTFGGLGIGLALTKRLIELHGGTIEATSGGVGRGSRFVLRLPAPAVSQPAVAARAGARVVGPSRRVLLADDNPDTTEMMRVMLELSGHEVRVANDGLEAVSLATDFRPQVALLDIGMPRLDGYSAAQRIRDALRDQVVLVALTGWGQDEDERRSREAGFDFHMTKPPDLDVLDRLIAGTIRDSRRVNRRATGHESPITNE